MKSYKPLSFDLIFILAISLFHCTFMSSCSRQNIVDRSKAMRESSGPETELLNQAIMSWPKEKREEHIDLSVQWLNKRESQTLEFGSCSLKASEYANEISKLKGKNDQEFLHLLQSDYRFYEVYGKDEWGEVLLTSYYSPVIQGSKRPSEKFSQALYSTPKDLYMISLGEFKRAGIFAPDAYSKDSLAARVEFNKEGQIIKIGPYFSRYEIDRLGSLENRGLVLAYVDPIDAFFLQIQGSGLVELEGGEILSLGYDAQNGHRYYSIGKSLFHKIPPEEMSKDRIVSYLRSLSREERNKLFDENPSYVFFRTLERNIGQTTFGPDVIDRRTIAIDYKVFPLGALGFIDFLSPRISDYNEFESFTPDDLEREGRFVLAHDSGGAIKGTGRVDLYWGKGDIASLNAGVMRHRGSLWFLVPKNCLSKSGDI